MPIDLQDLVITATISTDANSTRGDQPPASPEAGELQAETKEEIIRECVQQVLEIMRKQTER